MKFLFTNKYFLLILGVYLANQMMNSVSNSVGVFYVTYVLGNYNLFGLFSMAAMLPMILGMFFTPLMVKKFGMYKTNLFTLILAFVVGIPYIIAGLYLNIVLMLLLMAVRGIFISPITATLGALTAEASKNAYLKHGVQLEGSMYACASMGTKIGSGVGVALAGWLLDVGGYDGTVAVQTPGALRAISLMYLIAPVLSILLQGLCASGLNVEKENRRLEGK